MILKLDPILLPLQRGWPFNLIAYLVRLSRLFVAASISSLVGLLVLKNASQFQASASVLPLAFALIGLLLSTLAIRLVVSESRRLLQSIRDSSAAILKMDQAIDLELAVCDPEKRVALYQSKEEIEQFKQKNDEMRERVEDILTRTVSFRFSVTVAKLMALVRQLSSTPIPNFSIYP